MSEKATYQQEIKRLKKINAELLKTCKLALVSVPDYETAEKRRNVCRRAIAKAEGIAA